jgi:hypothetical protein
MPRASKHPTYRVGQIVCRYAVWKGAEERHLRLAVAEVGVDDAYDNRGRPKPALRAWNVASDGKHGEKRGASRRPHVWLLEEIFPLPKGRKTCPIRRK